MIHFFCFFCSKNTNVSISYLITRSTCRITYRRICNIGRNITEGWWLWFFAYIIAYVSNCDNLLLFLCYIAMHYFYYLYFNVYYTTNRYKTCNCIFLHSTYECSIAWNNVADTNIHFW